MWASLGGWIVDLPTIWAIAAVVGIMVSLSMLGLAAFHAAVPHSLRRAHNDVAGFTIAVVGVIYAVLLAFIAVAVWEDFGKADDLVQNEANLVGNLYRDTVGIRGPAGDGLRDDLFVYAETVVQDEWPAMAQGELDGAAGWQLLDRFHLSLSKLGSADTSTPGLEQEMLRNVNALYDARRGRFHAAEAGLPPILWWNLIAGAVLTIVFSYFFGLPSFRMHLAMVGMLGASIALVLALIVLLDNPFRGQNHVSDAPFVHLVQTVEAREYPHD